MLYLPSQRLFRKVKVRNVALYRDCKARIVLFRRCGTWMRLSIPLYLYTVQWFCPSALHCNEKSVVAMQLEMHTPRTHREMTSSIINYRTRKTFVSIRLTTRGSIGTRYFPLEKSTYQIFHRRLSRHQLIFVWPRFNENHDSIRRRRPKAAMYDPNFSEISSIFHGKNYLSDEILISPPVRATVKSYFIESIKDIACVLCIGHRLKRSYAVRERTG